ncbi:Alpha/Beta hydrolase protein [Paraphoma chrysanthemicola]|uniref:Alpha/Beta hydrolase protein n=1 Tax=Paraphoma chrysanthemicola TaxID=798071 RepID=A0A8K0VW07_9PLEO|nr:Alpha/Beta hydrolase protein [Paraphoma chrysanthemicola]
MSSRPGPRLRDKMKKLLAALATTGFKLGFGFFSLATVWATAVIKDGALFAEDTEEEKKELDAAQQKFWSLSAQPLSGFKHAFFTTTKGLNLHYVTNADEATSSPRNVAIFIHGFPDSFLLWRHILQSPELLRKHTLIAVDLPGYGGSDSLPAYGANEMLETMTDFVLGMRKQFLYEESKLVVVTHDWGAIVGARLAAEASVLADRWIITSAIIPSLTASNAAAAWSVARQMFHTWLQTPFHWRLLKNAAEALHPVRSQFRRSFYIFCFHLPWPFSNFFATFGNYWFLRLLHSLGKGKPQRNEKLLSRLTPKEAGEAMATSTGPGASQLSDLKGKSIIKYGESVRRRVHDRGMAEKIRIYREGLFLGKWEKSLETTAALFDLAQASPNSNASSSLVGGISDGALRAPTTLILGERDPAFEQKLGLNNVKNVLTASSQAVVIKDAGHWLPLEPAGRRVLEKTVLWALAASSETESDKAMEPFAEMSDVRVIVQT